MAFKPISMHQIRQLIGFLSKGYSISETVRLTGMARNTVREYKRRIEDQGLRLEDVVAMNDEALATVVQDNKAIANWIRRDALKGSRKPDGILLRRTASPGCDHAIALG